MRVLLVRPRRRKQAITLGEFMFSEPIGLECVVTVLKDLHEVRILDLMADESDFRTELEHWQPDVVGFTSLCIDVFAVLELAQQVKAYQREIVTLVGGTQAFFSPENYFCPEIDHVLQYTTVDNLRALFHHLADAETFPLLDGILSQANGFRGTGKAGFNDYIVPDRRSTAQYRQYYSYFGYKPAAIMQTSRGCSSVCKFCMRWKIEGTREVDVPMDVVIAQIEEIEERTIMFYDNNFLYSHTRLQEFCARLEKEGIARNFIAYGSVRSIIENAGLLKRLRKNGLRALLVGYESFSQKELDGYNKKVTIEDNLRAAQLLKEADIDCWASFILNPEWDVRDFKDFRKYMRQLRPEISSLVPMTPFPKTWLYEQYQDRLLYNPEDFDQWSFSVVMVKPGKMSLRRYYFEVLRSNLFVNLLLNNPTYMVKQFGLMTVWRIFTGSLKFLKVYIKLMLKG